MLTVLTNRAPRYVKLLKNTSIKFPAVVSATGPKGLSAAFTYTQPDKQNPGHWEFKEDYTEEELEKANDFIIVSLNTGKCRNLNNVMMHRTPIKLSSDAIIARYTNNGVNPN